MNITCPRCDAHLSQAYATEPPLCIACGWEDYAYAIPQRERHRDGLMSGLASQLRYIGEANALQGVTTSARVERSEKAQAGIATVVSCPYDGKDMKAVPKSGYSKGKNERTYKCGRKHRIIVLSSANGDWRGWM